ncbi:hypothetical protein B7486_57140, partial [cyanobacterium TDX16]
GASRRSVRVVEVDFHGGHELDLGDVGVGHADPSGRRVVVGRCWSRAQREQRGEQRRGGEQVADEMAMAQRTAPQRAGRRPATPVGPGGNLSLIGWCGPVRLAALSRGWP